MFGFVLGLHLSFQLGLSLQEGDESTADDKNRVGQVIVAGFSRFTEALMMV
jgi:hypothetical protein